MSLQAVANIIQQPESSNKHKAKQQTKYQERLPWESKHISPYIPKLNKVGFKNDYYIPEVNNYDITKSFQPFLEKQINPIRKNNEDYSEQIKNLDEEEQARYTMDKFREFLIENSRPELSTESGLMNMKYRNRLMQVLEKQRNGQTPIAQSLNQQSQLTNLQTNANGVASISNQDNHISQKLINMFTTGSRNPANQQSSATPINYSINNSILQSGNAFQNKPIPFNQQYDYQEGLITPQKNSASPYLSNDQLYKTSQENKQYNQQQQQQLYGQQVKQSSLYQSNDAFSKQLCFDYEKILLSEGKLKRGQDGKTWNNTSEQYLQKIVEWSSDNDQWISQQLLQNKDVQTAYFLQPRIFRQVRPLDKIKREMIETGDGQLIPYESVVERRSVEIMHQRDYLVEPYLMQNFNGEYEVINDIFTYDRSFIIEQNPLTKTEILHEYPVQLNEEQLLDFLFQTGIETKQVQQYFSPPQPIFYDPSAYPYVQQQYQQQQQQQQQVQQQQQPRQQQQQSLKQIAKQMNNQRQNNTVNQQEDKNFNYDEYKREDLRKYFMNDQQETFKQKKGQNQKKAMFKQESAILPNNNNNNRESQFSIDNYI